MKKTYLVDIDNTILFSDEKQCAECGRWHYELKTYDKKEVAAIKKKAREGHTIIFWTGRKGDIEELTKQQLKQADLVEGWDYSDIIFNKPCGIYVDKEAVKSIADG